MDIQRKLRYKIFYIARGMSFLFLFNNCTSGIELKYGISRKASVALQSDKIVYISDLPWQSEENGSSIPLQRDTASNGNPILLNGVSYEKGVGAHAYSKLEINIHGGYNRFVSDIGLDDSREGLCGSISFQVKLDNITVYTSGDFTNETKTGSIDIDVSGKDILTLEVLEAGGGICGDHADWANAQLVVDSGSPNPLPPTAGDDWLQAPPVLINPLVVSNYNSYGSGSSRSINGAGGDVLLLAHAPNGMPEVLRNVRLNIKNFRRLHVKGLDIELDDPSFAETRALNFHTGGSPNVALIEEIFIEGLHINNHFIQDNADAIAMYYLGSRETPVKRFVLQKSRIAGVGTPGNGDGPNVHPDMLQFQGGVFIESVFIEMVTGTTMYQGLFTPWDDTNSPNRQPESAAAWKFRNVNLVSEDDSTNRLIVLQNEGKSAEVFPRTTFNNVYLSQRQNHSFGVGAAAIHVNPRLFDDSPYEFVPEARITGTPTPGRAPSDFAPRNSVGIYYNP